MKSESQEKLEAAMKAGKWNKNTNFFVKNINGTSKPPYAGTHGKNLLEKYRQHTGSTAKKCARNGCNRPARVGAHVQQKDGRDKDGAAWHIVPLCKSCNNHKNTDVMVISAKIHLVLLSDL
jgi:hypothetical protein